jgi:hypothetical protein
LKALERLPAPPAAEEQVQQASTASSRGEASSSHDPLPAAGLRKKAKK